MTATLKTAYGPSAGGRDRGRCQKDVAGRLWSCQAQPAAPQSSSGNKASQRRRGTESLSNLICPQWKGGKIPARPGAVKANRAAVAIIAGKGSVVLTLRVRTVLTRSVRTTQTGGSTWLRNSSTWRGRWPW